MQRRDFLKLSFGLGIAGAFSQPVFAKGNRLNPLTGTPPDIVVVRGVNPEKMVSAGIEALGGISKFMKPRQSILVKPTMEYELGPEKSVNTNPELLRRIIKECQNAHSGDVFLLDYATDDWRKTYKTSGIETIAKQTMSKMIPANDTLFFTDKLISTEKIKIHRKLTECDVFINVPAWGFDEKGNLIDGFQNLTGLIWNRGEGYIQSKEVLIENLLSFRKPGLTVIDALSIANEPTGIKGNVLILSADMVAADTYARKILLDKDEIPGYLKKLEQMGIGNTHTEQMNIQEVFV